MADCLVELHSGAAHIMEDPRDALHCKLDFSSTCREKEKDLDLLEIKHS